ncbi:MAG: leucine-rich repeat domain-containing protein [Bacteroidota bacterium]
MKNTFILTVLLLFFKTSGFAQTELLDSMTLATYQEYIDLDEALKDPDNVIKLTLRKKKYKEFPKQVYKFKNLQYLDLSKNDIKELPDSLIIFKNLQYFIATKNGLESLPNNIGKLSNLKFLNVNQNEISRLPYSFGQLENLEIADLWSNNLEYFPETMKDLKNLRMMDLRNILIPQNHQDNIQSMLPNTLIHFSPPCKCSW